VNASDSVKLIGSSLLPLFDLECPVACLVQLLLTGDAGELTIILIGIFKWSHGCQQNLLQV
jgi:hypothetical protein